MAPERVKPSWFIERGWWQGISECYREQLAGQAGFGQLSRGGERMIRGLYKSLKNITDPAKRFDNFVYAYGQIGYLSSKTLRCSQNISPPAVNTASENRHITGL